MSAWKNIDLVVGTIRNSHLECEPYFALWKSVVSLNDVCEFPHAKQPRMNCSVFMTRITSKPCVVYTNYRAANSGACQVAWIAFTSVPALRPLLSWRSARFWRQLNGFAADYCDGLCVLSDRQVRKNSRLRTCS